LEVSPLLGDNAAATTNAAAELHRRARRPNLFIKIPGTPAGLPAIEASIFGGVPVNVTLLFTATQYVAAAEAYMRGIERRIAAGLNPKVASVASLSVSPWDVAVHDTAPAALRNRLGIAIAGHVYREYRRLLASPRWEALAAAGVLPQRLLWAGTGTTDADAPDTLYVEALAAPDTIDAMPEETLTALHDHGRVEGGLPADGGDAEGVLVEFASSGVDVTELAARLQREGTAAFTASWNDLLGRLTTKRTEARTEARTARGRTDRSRWASAG
jgi:transaldolase